MAYYQNGHQYYNGNPQQVQQQPAAPQYQNHYSRPASYNNGDGPDYGSNNGANYTYGYGNDAPQRHNSTAGIQNEELFMGAAQSPHSSQGHMSPTAASVYSQPYSPQQYPQQAGGPQSSGYNPRNYAAPVAQPNPTAFGGVTRTFTGGSPPLPYNPAAYADNSIHRNNTIGHAYGMGSPSHASPTSQHYSSPSISSQSQFPVGHPYSQSESQPQQNAPSFSHFAGSTPQPPRPSAYTPPAPPPLPVPPRSGTLTQEQWSNNSAAYTPPSQSYHHYNQSTDSGPPRTHALPSPPAYSHGSRHNSYGQVESPSNVYGGQSANPIPYPPEAPPHGSPQRMNTTGRHPQSRPLPGPPMEGRVGGNRQDDANGSFVNQDELFDQVENAFRNAGSSPGAGPRIEVNQHPINGDEIPAAHEPQFGRMESGRRQEHTSNGHLSPNLRPSSEPYGYSDESDVEAAAGLAALQMAEAQEEADEARRRSGGSGLFSTYTNLQPSPQPQRGASQNIDAGSDSDYVPVDMGLYTGSYEPHFSYGGDPNELAAGGTLPPAEMPSHTVSSSNSLRRREDVNGFQENSIHPFPPFTAASVDTSGTGGLSDPTTNRRRLSYDEGDENNYVDTQRPVAGEPPDMFYHPGMSLNRPLPPTPADEPEYPRPQDGAYGQSAVRYDPNAYDTASQGQGQTTAQRATSLLNQSSAPQTIPPARAKTDAEQSKLRQQQFQNLSRGSTLNNSEFGGATIVPSSAEAAALGLPSLPAGRRFNPAKLTATDFKRCAEPWALSSVIDWLKSMAEGEADLKESAILEGLAALFAHKVPTMSIADSEMLSNNVLQEMYGAGTLVQEEEWLKFTNETRTGVIYQLTGHGCYASRLHEHPTSGRCYSHYCQRTVKKIDLQTQPALSARDDWATFYKIKKEDVENVSKKEVQRQNNLHEIVQGEDKYMEDLDVLRLLYRDRLLKAQPPVISPKKLEKFLRDIFGRVDAVKKANEDYLLPQMKYRQKEQGPWVVGFSDIFRDWIRKARQAYIDYAGNYPYATLLVRQEAERNILFRSFLDQARAHKLSNRLEWDSFLKAPITRLQRYGLLLDTVLKSTHTDGDEKRSLQAAIDEIKAVTMECDARVDEMSKKVDLADLQSKLILRPAMNMVELRLDQLGRELIYRGDLLRMGGSRFNWVETHALLFDHYLILAKTYTSRGEDGATRSEKYDISKRPIPMDLLTLESAEDEPVIKSSVKGITNVSVAKQNGAIVADPRLGRTISNQSPSPGTLSHTNTSSSINTLSSTSSGKTMITNTVLENPKDDKIMYPFRVKYLGREMHTLYASSHANRAEWCEKITEAKTRHAAALFRQNAEPFRLRVMADAAFAYESGAPGQKTISIRGTPLDRAIQDVERLYAHTGRPPPVCRARVNCATAFMQPYGKNMVAVGTDNAVYITEIDNSRGWSRAIQMPRVTQIAVLEEFSLFLVLSDKSLIAYHLDVVCPPNGATIGNDTQRKQAQKLSGSRDVGFFATGKMKDRTLVFYKRREGVSSVFKVLEPIFQKSTEKKSRMFRSGRTEFFREYDDFYIGADCSGINLFKSSLTVSSSRGFEFLTLDKKQTWSVPDLKAPHVASIAARLVNMQPLGMFRLSEQEFLLCYEECAVYVNKHGDISRSCVMEFVGRPRSAALYGPYILLFDPDFVEVRNAQNGRLRQVIAGRDVKCLDDGESGGTAGHRTIKICLQHPEYERCQLVVELVLNEGQKE